MIHQYILTPENVEIFNEENVIRNYFTNTHVNEEGDLIPELFLPRIGEPSLSVIVEKLINNRKDFERQYRGERKYCTLNALKVRELLVGVTHTPSNKDKKHGSLHGFFDLQKALDLLEIIE